MVPPLREGDRMDADEFMRRYEAMPEGVRAELIGGTVYMPPPASAEDHGGPHTDLIYLMAFYRRHTPGVGVYTTSTVRLGRAEVPEPDVSMRLEAGGFSRLVDGYITGPPELAAEVAASSDSIDRHAKFQAYQSAGIPEYIIWRTLRRLIEWHVLDAGRYTQMPPGADGILRSRVFPGFWVDPAALLANDLARAEEVLRLGLATPEHAAFIAEMTRRLSQPGP
jgi:Uma2 family endonuclease